MNVENQKNQLADNASVLIISRKQRITLLIYSVLIAFFGIIYRPTYIENDGDMVGLGYQFVWVTLGGDGAFVVWGTTMSTVVALVMLCIINVAIIKRDK